MFVNRRKEFAVFQKAARALSATIREYTICRFCDEIRATTNPRVSGSPLVRFTRGEPASRPRRRPVPRRDGTRSEPASVPLRHRVMPPMRSRRVQREARRFAARVPHTLAPAVAIRRASLIKINYVCRVIVRLIESRDSTDVPTRRSSAVAVRQPPPAATVPTHCARWENGNGEAESTFCTDARSFSCP